MNIITREFNSKVKGSVVQLFIATCGVFIAVFALQLFNQKLLMSFSLPLQEETKMPVPHVIPPVA